MHEMAIVQSIMDILEQHARMYNAKRVVQVSLEFGALTAVMPAAITFAFRISRQGGDRRRSPRRHKDHSYESSLHGLRP